MRKLLLPLLCYLFPALLFAQMPGESYKVDPASVEHSGVPKGEVIKLTFENSKIFPGTWREYWIYIPKQYDPAKPACVYVSQDRVLYNAPTVFDNLINSKEMPVTIGIFVAPGQVRALDDKTALNRYNRSLEYDGLGDDYSRFLLEEIFPDAEKHKTSDGRVIRLSRKANDCAIGGSSSGGVAAFTVAWERPDAFSRVFTGVGTYVGLRGADRYPALIRKYEAKPLRLFLQDGSNDQNIYAGDWFYANQMMERSLTFAGNQVRHEWGIGAHSGFHATAIYPEAMRWLWKDYPQPVTTSPSKNALLSKILIPGEGWQLVGEGYGNVDGITAASNGELTFEDITHLKTYKILPDGKPEVVRTNKASVIGNIMIANDNNRITAKNGNEYKATGGKIYLSKAGSKKRIVVDADCKNPGGLAFTPDQSQLYVGDAASHWIWLYQLKADGTLAYKQHYGWLYQRDDQDNSGIRSIRCDTSGYVYTATSMGVQILDQAGRVNAIFPLPTGRATNLCFGGANFDMLYVLSGDKLYRRKLNVRGTNNFEEPIKPNKPKL